MKKLGLNAFWLHIIAITFMLCDHLWATVIPGNDWLTCIGRLAFPIFAFMIVEGYFHTGSIKKYALRIFIFAVISEIPFNLMYGGNVFYPFHQNVLWTFLLSLGCIVLIEKVKKKGKPWLTVLAAIPITLLGTLLGFLIMSDYFGFGVVTVLVFYFFRGRKWYHFMGQLICLLYINAVLFGGLQYPVTLFGLDFLIPQQGFAVLALIPIWLYNGEKGPYCKAVKYIWYGFYPAHILVLALLFKIIR